jgi:oxazoline/thiazoline dehydrogenase
LSASLRLSWRGNVSLSAGDGLATIEAPGTRFSLKVPRPEIVDAMQRLTPPGEEEERLNESILAAGGVTSLAKWFYCLNGLGERGLIHKSLEVEGRRLATFVPFGKSLGERNVRQARMTTSTRHRLSRFTYLRRQGADMVVESPLANGRVVLHDSRAAMLVASLAAPVSLEELATTAGDVPIEAAKAFVDLLALAQFLEQVDGADLNGEPDLLETWEFHDLLFHSRSRRGRSDAPCGGTFRLAHRPPPAAIKKTAAKKIHPLYRPDLEQMERGDPPLAFVQERRRSLREYADRPITAQQMGEFLYRAARVKDQWTTNVSTHTGKVPLDFVSRPYPSGGAMYELEFYASVRACQGLDAGLYHYDPVEHQLARVEGSARDLAALLDDASASAAIDPKTLQVLIVLAARFERIAWKYESIAYALVLKHVGVVYQTMYLAATAMGLAPCALGCGDSDVFARASGNDYYRETSVGEFLLGSRKSV